MGWSFTVQINTFNWLKTGKESRAFCLGQGQGRNGERTGSGTIWMEAPVVSRRPVGVGHGGRESLQFCLGS